MKAYCKYLLATAVLAASLVSCQETEPIVGTQDKDGFFLNRTSLTLPKGSSESLTATVTPKGAGAASWSSSDESVATVADGVVTAVGGGEAVISAQFGSKTLSCKVWVSSAVTAVTLNEHEVDFDKGESRQLSYEMGPDDINVPLEVSWSSTDENVLTVDENGLVTAVGGGKASIVLNVNGVTDVCEFFSHCYPTGIEITPASASVSVNQSVRLTARLLPEDVTEELAFVWSVTDTGIASVDAEGLVQGLSAGNTQVVVTAGAFSAEAELTVTREVKTVELTPTSVNHTEGDVTLTFGPGCYHFSDYYGMEVVAGSYFTVSVPDGYQIDKIEFTPSYNATLGDFTVDTGNYARSGGNHSWEAAESTSSVTFSNPHSAEYDIRVFRITYQ